MKNHICNTTVMTSLKTKSEDLQNGVEFGVGKAIAFTKLDYEAELPQQMSLS